jgi:hypothetical protein
MVLSLIYDMTTLIVHPENQAQEKAVKAVLEVLNISFEKVSDAGKADTLPDHIVEAINNAQHQIANGKVYSYAQVRDIVARKPWR